MNKPVATLKQLWQRARGSAMGYGLLGTAIRAGAQFLLLPVVLTVLSPAELNIWWLFLSLGTLVFLADFGFGQALTRVYSFLWAGAEDFDTEGLRPPPESREPNLPRLRQVHGAAARIYLRLALAATIVAGLAGTWFVAPHILATTRPWWNWAAWLTYLVATAYSLATLPWGLACQGTNRVREFQRATLWSSAWFFIVAAGLLYADFGLMALVVAATVRAAIARQLCRRAYEAAVPPQPGPPTADPQLFQRLWPNARRYGVTFIGAYLLSNGNLLIASLILPADQMASFGLTMQVGLFITGLANMWLSVKWPEITILRTQGRERELAVLFARRLGCMLASFAVLAVAVPVVGVILLEWKGTTTQLLPTGMMAIYFASLLWQSAYGAFGSFACTANVMPFPRVALLTGAGMVTLSLLLAPNFGLWGMLLAPPLAEACGNAWFYVREGWRRQPLPPREFARAMMNNLI